MTRKIRDISGQRFGHLVALRPISDCAEGNSGYRWLFRCDCGKTRELNIQDLCPSRIKYMKLDCGCLDRNGKPKDLTGRRFGNFTVLKLDTERTKPHSLMRARAWICRCDCGNIRSRKTESLKRGKQHCGCITTKLQPDKRRRNLRICKKYCAIGTPFQTLQQIALEEGITKEAVRLILRSTLKRFVLAEDSRR